MSGNKMNKGNGSKLISKLAAKLAPTSVKRPLQTTSPSGPSVKKINVTGSSSFNNRKVEENAPKEKKDLKSVFEITSKWKDGVETLEKLSDFAELAAAAASSPSEKSLRIEGFVLAVIKFYIDGDKSDSDVITKLAMFIVEEKEHCKSDNILQALFELLPIIEAKESIPALASSITSVIKSYDCYPPLLLKLVINDSCGRRLWVDQIDSTQTYYSILSVFGNFILPSIDLYQQAEIPWAKKIEYDRASHPCKFDMADESLKQVINEAITKVSQRCAEEANKSLIRTLLFMIRNKQIQRAAVKRLDTWLSNVKLQRSVMDLLLTFACNITEIVSSDSREFLNDLVMMQSFRSKQHLVVLQVSIDILYKNFPGVMGIFMDSILEAEFSPKLKLSHTYSLMHFLYSLNSADASKILANRFVRILHQQKTVKQVRGFLREFTKTAFRGNDFLFDEFTRYIYEAVKEKCLFGEGFSTTELFKNVVNLCAVLPFSAVVSNIKESGNLRRSGNALTAAQAEVLARYYGQLKHFMGVSVEFLKWASSANLCQQLDTYMEAYNQLLYLGHGGYKSYNAANDAWPSEVEYNSVFRLIQECPIDDCILLPLVTMNGSTQIGADKIIQLLELITRKLVTFSPIPSDHSLISLSNFQVFEKTLELSLIKQADGDKPKISNREMYQRAWFLIFKWIILNKNGVFKEAYDKYPLLKMMIHMTVINNFEYPLQMFNGKAAREIEAENAALEKAESEIVASFQRPAKEDSSNSNPPQEAPSNFCLFQPMGPPRKFFELFGNLRNFSKEHPIALYLCGIRNPDILGALANDKLSDQALPVIQDAIAKHPMIVETLPLQTLSQLFFYDLINSDNSRKKSVDTSFIRSKLQKTLGESNETTKEIVDYFLAKLCSHSSDDRHGALMAIQLLIGDITTEDHPINAFSKLPIFHSISDLICRELSYSVTIEGDMKLVMDNISFIAKHMKSGDIHLIALRLTKIVERVGGKSDDHKHVHQALLDFFASYLNSLLTHSTTEIPKVDDDDDPSNEILRIKIPQHEEKFNISSKVLTGIMTLLCEYTGTTGESNNNRELLLNTWFGTDKNQKPSVQRVSDNAEVNILPHNLKTKMLSSADERIANAALLGMSVDCALNFLQSSAITPYAYSKLLSIVNANKPPRGNLRSIATFVRAYKIKGAQGADEFLSYIDEVEGSNSNDQLGFNQRIFVLDPPPTRQMDPPDFGKKQYNFDKCNEVLKYLRAMNHLKAPQIILDSNWAACAKALKQKKIATSIAKSLKTAKFSEELLNMILYAFMDGYQLDSTAFGKIFAELAETFKNKSKLSRLLQNFAPKDVEMEEVTEEEATPMEDSTNIEKITKDTPDSEIPKTLKTANLKAYFAIVEIFDATATMEQARIDKAIENLKKLSKKLPDIFASYLQVMTDRITPILAMTDKKHREDQYIKLLELGLEMVLEIGPFSFKNEISLNLLIRPYLDFFYNRVTYSKRFERSFELLVECCLEYMMQNQKSGKEFLKNESQFFKAMQAFYNIEELSVLIREIDDLIVT